MYYLTWNLWILKLSELQIPTNRTFGFFFAGIFALAGGYCLKEGLYSAAYVFFVLVVAFFLVTVIKAELLLPLNRLWMFFGLLLGKIVSPLVLGVIFFGLIAPIALVMRIAGRDELRLKVKAPSSLWKTSDENSVSSVRFENQF